MMPQTEPNGCLTVLLSFVGINLGGPAQATHDLPYHQRDDFLSAAEYSFYRVLCSAIGQCAVICPKVNLADVFFVVRPNENQVYRNKIDRKHVDFLICDPITMKPKCGVELDDSSHSRRDRQDRDEFVEQVFEVAGLPLIRVPAKAAYDPEQLLAMLEPHLNGGPAARTLSPPVRSSGTPMCPKCGVAMVERVAKTGPNTGQALYGCPNYPRCKKIVKAT